MASAGVPGLNPVGRSPKPSSTLSPGSQSHTPEVSPADTSKVFDVSVAVKVTFAGADQSLAVAPSCPVAVSGTTSSAPGALLRRTSTVARVPGSPSYAS